MAAEHGTRTRYNAGCKCEQCAAAEREYKRDRRAQKRAEKDAGGTPADATVHQLPPTVQPATDTETVEAAVRREIEKRETTDRPGLVATAIALAKVLDNRGAIMQHAAAAGRLADILERVNGMTPKVRSTVSKMRDEFRSGSV